MEDYNKSEVDMIELRKQYFIELDREIGELIDSQTGFLSEKYSHHIHCPLCSSDDDERIFIKRGYTFVRCRKCGLIYTNPQVNIERLTDAYGESKANDLWVRVTLDPQERLWKQGYYADHLEILKSVVGNNRFKLLDIGCSTGQFMEIAHEQGLDVTGLELNNTAFNYVQDVLNLKVLKVKLEDSDFAKNTFDVCTLFGVLEHLPDPLQVLKHAVYVTKNGGYIMAVVPNVYSLYHMFIQEKSVTFDGRNHLIYYSLDTVRRLFNEAGLNILICDTVLTGLNNIIRQAQFFDPYSDNSTKQYLPEKLKDIINNNSLTKSMLEYDLGLRIRVLGKVEK